MLLALVAVCLVAYALLKWGLAGLLGTDHPDDGPIDVLARKPIGPDTTILVVRVGPEVLILGNTDAGLNRLGELDETDLDDFEPDDDHPDTDRSFTSILRRALTAGPEPQPDPRDPTTDDQPPTPDA